MAVSARRYLGCCPMLVAEEWQGGIDRCRAERQLDSTRSTNRTKRARWQEDLSSGGKPIIAEILLREQKQEEKNTVQKEQSAVV